MKNADGRRRARALLKCGVAGGVSRSGSRASLGDGLGHPTVENRKGHNKGETKGCGENRMRDEERQMR